MKIPLRNGEACCQLHPVSLSLKIPMHWWRLEARVWPESGCPAEQAHDHEYKREQYPLRDVCSSGPEKASQGEVWSLCGQVVLCFSSRLTRRRGGVWSHGRYIESGLIIMVCSPREAQLVL